MVTTCNRETKNKLRRRSNHLEDVQKTNNRFVLLILLFLVDTSKKVFYPLIVDNNVGLGYLLKILI